MQTLGLNNSGTTANPGFLARQFQTPPTYSQKTFDWIFGVFLPVVCFVFDPIVFRSGFGETALLGGLRPFAYLLSFACITTMAAWLIYGEKLRWLSGFLAGLFLLGGSISLIVGLFLLPFSIAGLIILIGALGFTPLLTAFVYLRNAARALHAAKNFLVKSVRIYAFAFGFIFSASLAWTINSEIRNSLERMVTGDAQTVYAESRKLKYFAPLVNFDKLVRAYYRPAENERMQREKMQALADVYKQLTGADIESRSRDLTD